MDSSSDEDARQSPHTSPRRDGRESPPTSPVPQPNSSPIHPSSSSPAACSSSSQSSPARKRSRRSHEQFSRMTLLRRMRAKADSEDSEDESEDEREEMSRSVEQQMCEDENTDIKNNMQADDQSEVRNESPIECSDSDSSSDPESDNSSSNVSAQSDGSLESAHVLTDECPSPSHSDDAVTEDEPEAIYLGSEISPNQAMLKTLELYIGQRMTKTNLDATVKLVKSLLPMPNLFPSSAKKLLADLNRLCKFQVEKEHFYCCKCKEEKIDEDSECENCLNCDCKGKEEYVQKHCNCKKTGVFFEFSIEAQLRHMFEHRGLAAAIDQYHTDFKKVDGCICDITDGTEYKKVHSELDNQYDIVLLLSSDGVQLSTSSKQEMWPILSVPCEVIPARRSAFMLVSGVYVGKTKPKMNTFLKPFVDTINSINSKGGMTWTHPQSKIVFKSRVVCPVLCADAPAKAIMLNVKHFSHRFGCNVCELKATKVMVVPAPEGSNERSKNKKKQKKKREKTTVRRFVFADQEAPLRTGARMDALGKLAVRRNKSRKGVLGLSVLSNLQFFDRGVCLCAEYLHLVCLGVVKYFLNILCDTKGPWYIGKDIEEIDAFLLECIKVPDFNKRLPKGLRNLAEWKGSELRAFLLFYSLPALERFLPNKYFQHWMLLVEAIYLLLKECITQEELNVADVMLRCFVRDIGTLYSKRYYVYNVHNLLHLCTFVKRWGNLWSTSAFAFENFNGFISSHVHGTKHLGKELLNIIKIIQSTKVLKTMVKDDLAKKTSDKVEVCGKELFEVLSDNEKLSLSRMKMENFKIFDRIKVNSVTFTSRHYDQHMKRANSFVQFCLSPNKFEYGEILHFVRSSAELYCIINFFDIVQTKWFFIEDGLYRLKHLIPVQSSGDLIVIPASCIVTKVMKAGMYLCLRPNPYEVNL